MEVVFLNRTRARTVFAVSLVIIVGLVVLLVSTYSVLQHANAERLVLRNIEIAAGLLLCVGAAMISGAIMTARRSRLLAQSLERAFISDRRRGVGRGESRFTEFGDLGAAIGEYGRALERRTRKIVEYADALERTLAQVLAGIEVEVIVLDGAGNVRATSPSGEELIEKTPDGSRILACTPPIHSVVRGALFGEAAQDVRVGKQKMYAYPIFVDRVRKTEERALAYLVLLPREGVRTIEIGQSAGGDQNVGLVRSILGRFSTRRR